MAAGEYFTLAATDTGGLFGWGDGGSGQLGRKLGLGRSNAVAIDFREKRWGRAFLFSLTDDVRKKRKK